MRNGIQYKEFIEWVAVLKFNWAKKRPALKKAGYIGMGGKFLARYCLISLGFMILHRKTTQDAPDTVFVWNDVFRHGIH